MKILLAVDGSRYTKKMLAYLTTHEDLFDGAHDFVALTVQAALPARARVAVGKDVVDDYYREEAEKVLKPVLTYLKRHQLKARGEWKAGPAGEIIARCAASGKFDLVMMGSHGQGALANLVMGSVATKVLANCEIPVLLVR
ncbi:MAG: universal stress protein [Burkholderiaceae bacterium]|jgi:nucleotide-binding universal stress UspA family protein|nr:universal stress protein [Burkholderiaceae bacterium]